MILSAEIVSPGSSRGESLTACKPHNTDRSSIGRQGGHSSIVRCRWWSLEGCGYGDDETASFGAAAYK